MFTNGSVNVFVYKFGKIFDKTSSKVTLVHNWSGNIFTNDLANKFTSGSASIFTSETNFANLIRVTSETVTITSECSGHVPTM